MTRTAPISAKEFGEFYAQGIGFASINNDGVVVVSKDWIIIPAIPLKESSIVILGLMELETIPEAGWTVRQIEWHGDQRACLCEITPPKKP